MWSANLNTKSLFLMAAAGGCLAWGAARELLSHNEKCAGLHEHSGPTRPARFLGFLLWSLAAVCFREHSGLIRVYLI